MLNGAKPGGKFGSAKSPSTVTGEKVPLNTSIVPALKLAAYSSAPRLLLPNARPLYTAPAAELSTMVTAVDPAAPFHPEIVPSSLANRKLAGCPPASTNSDVLLKT